jgi:transposase
LVLVPPGIKEALIMAKPLVSDELWDIVEPILPAVKEMSPKGGRPPLGNREALTGIIFVLKTGIPWEDLPQEMGCGCGMTCWRRLRDWQEAGVWDELHLLLLDGLNRAEAIDWSRAVVDSGSVRAIGGGQKPGQTRPIAANRGASITCSRTPRAFPWRAKSPRRTTTT